MATISITTKAMDPILERKRYWRFTDFLYFEDQNQFWYRHHCKWFPVSYDDIETFNLMPLRLQHKIWSIKLGECSSAICQWFQKIHTIYQAEVS